MFKKLISMCMIIGILVMCLVPMSVSAALNVNLESVRPSQVANASATGLAMSDDYVFVNYGTWIEVFDITESTAPQYLTKIVLNDSSSQAMTARNIYVKGDYLIAGFCKGNTKKIAIYDIEASEVLAPAVTGVVTAKEGAAYTFDLAIGGNYAYAFARSHSISQYDISNEGIAAAISAGVLTPTYTFDRQTSLGKLTEKTNVPDIYNKTTAYSEGGYLYYTVGGMQCLYFCVARISNAGEFSLIGYYPLSDYTTVNNNSAPSISDICVNGDYVYVTTNSSTNMTINNTKETNGLYIFNTADAKASGTHAEPVMFTVVDKIVPGGTSNQASTLQGMRASGNYLYVWGTGSAIKKLLVYDISNPAAPTLLTSWDTSSYVGFQNAISNLHPIWVNGNVIYSASYINGLLVHSVPDIAAEAFVLTQDGETLTNLQEGVVNAELTVNNYLGEEQTANVILALYNNGELEDVVVSEQTISANAPTEIDVSIEVPSLEGYRLKAMLWDDLTNRNLKYMTYSNSAITSTGIELLPAGAAAQTPPAAATNDAINVSAIDDEGFVTISGKLTQGAGKPVSVLVVNESVNNATDRLGGIRLIDSAVSGEEGYYYFKFKATDGGTYKIYVNGNNGKERLQETLVVEKPQIKLRNSIDAPGEETCMQVQLTYGSNVDTLDITLDYNPDVLLVSGSDAIAASEYFTVTTSDVDPSGQTTVTLKKKEVLSRQQISVLFADATVKAETPFGDYAVTITATAKDRFGNIVESVSQNGTFTIQATSPKTEAREAARTALALVKEAEAINYDNYSTELLLVQDARTKLDYALGINVKATDFGDSIKKLEKAEQKTAKLAADFVVLSSLNNATSETVDGIFSTNKEVFGATDTMLDVYKALEDSATVRDILYGQSYATPTLVEKAFSEKLAFEAMRQLNWTYMEEIVSSLNGVIGFDVEGDFAEFDETQQSEVYRAIAKTDYATFVAMQDAFDAAVKVVLEKEDGNQGNNNIIGGTPGITVGANGGGASSPITKVPEIYFKEFTDIKDVPWAQKQINYLFEKGIVNGKGEGVFAPNDTIKREEFIKIIVSALGLHNPDATCDFKDVAKGSWYASYIASAVESGIINGVGDNMFGIGSEITRQDMAVILCRAQGLISDTKIEEPSFGDWKDVSDYAKQSIAIMVEKGIINGISDTELAPLNSATRAQAAVMIYGIIQLPGAEA